MPVSRTKTSRSEWAGRRRLSSRRNGLDRCHSKALDATGYGRSVIRKWERLQWQRLVRATDPPDILDRE